MFGFIKEYLPPPLYTSEESFTGQDEYRLGTVVASLDEKGIGMDEIACEFKRMRYLAPGSYSWAQLPQGNPNAVLQLLKGKHAKIGSTMIVKPEGLVFFKPFEIV